MPKISKSYFSPLASICKHIVQRVGPECRLQWKNKALNLRFAAQTRLPAEHGDGLILVFFKLGITSY